MATKILQAETLHDTWKKEDISSTLENKELVQRQKLQCREIGLLIFGFALHEEQVDALWTLFYQATDLLLLAKTGFEKSLIFQLLLFMSSPCGVVLILMPLKLL